MENSRNTYFLGVSFEYSPEWPDKMYLPVVCVWDAVTLLFCVSMLYMAHTYLLLRNHHSYQIAAALVVTRPLLHLATTPSSDIRNLYGVIPLREYKSTICCEERRGHLCNIYQIVWDLLASKSSSLRELQASKIPCLKTR